MRIVSWNCNGALRNKLELLDALKPDVCIVQECENPATTRHARYKAWAGNALWVGDNPHRGLGVFAGSGLHVESVALDADGLQLFLPCLINQRIALLAAWTKQANSPTFKYIGQLWKYLQKHESFLSSDSAMLIGDLNSNACWDVWDRWWNHSDVVEQLRRIGVHSLYHASRNESQGAETQPTFYMYRKLSRPFHIDYAFLSSALMPGASLTIGAPDDWLPYSDHLPLIIDLPDQ